MSDHPSTGYDPMTGEEELQGPERYLRPGEELLIYTPDIQIKKFRFDAYLTNTRLFLTDQDEKTPGVTAKEIPIESVADTYLEHSPVQEPILVLSIRTSDDDLRTMKMTFVHTGADRLPQAEEWMHLIMHGHAKSSSGGTAARLASPQPVPAISPEARALSETIIYPEKTTVEPAPLPSAGPAVVQEEGRTRTPPPQPRQPEAPRAASTPPGATTTQIQFCFHCGHKLPPNANFCPYCGTRLHQAGAPLQSPSPIQIQRTADEPASLASKEKEKRGLFGWLFRRK